MTKSSHDSAASDLFGEFPGCRIQGYQADTIMATHWPKKELKREPSLFANKWWDYRTFNPVYVTYLFAHLFTQETRRIIRAHINDTPPRVTATGKIIDWEPIKAGDIFEPPALASRKKAWERKIGSLVRVRQKADDASIPYPIFIKAGLKHYYFGRGTYLLHQSPILDISLLTNEDCFHAICAAMMEEYDMRVLIPEHPRFKDPEREDAEMKEFHQWVIAQLDRRVYPERSAAKIVVNGQIKESVIRKFLENRGSDLSLFDATLHSLRQKIALD